MKEFFTNLKTTVKEHPVETIVAATLVVSTTAKLIVAVTNANNSRTWSKEVNRRVAKTK